MKTRAIILTFFLLLPLVPAKAQKKDKHREVIVCGTCGRLINSRAYFDGGDANKFSAWVKEHQRYPEDAKKAGIEGRVTTQFTITKEGKLINVRILRGVHPLLDEEAVRVIESAPQLWEPAWNKKGEPIDVTYAFPVIFKLTDEERAQMDSVPFVAFDYGVKEKKPSFNNGGYFEFAKWIREHLVYPEEAKKAGLEGRVYVSVIIDGKGKLVNPVVYRSTNKIFEEEALRVISSAPDKWKPGLNAKGEPIALSLLIPVNFNLPNK